MRGTYAIAALLALATCVDPTTGENTAPSSYDDAVLHADVADSEGDETIRASIENVVVLDGRGTTVASTPAFAPQGSADEVVGIRLINGGGVGAPMFAVTTTIGGRRESTTYTALYRVRGRALDTLFVGPIEQVEGDHVTTGLLLVFPSTVLYRAPRAELATFLSFDVDTRRFVAR